MNRTQKRQQAREIEKDLKKKDLENKGFRVIRGEYEVKRKRNIANRKSSYSTPEEENADRQIIAEETLKVYRKVFPILLKRLSKIRDPRQPKKTKHKLTVLMIYGILMFVFTRTSLRNANKEISSPIFFENMKAMFPELETLPHTDTLKRLLEEINVQEIEESMLDLLEHLIKNKKFKNNLINGKYLIAIDGTQKFFRDDKWAEECLTRHVGTDKKEQYYVYVLESVIILDNGMTLPLMTEFLENEGDGSKENIKETAEKKKQDCERKGFYRIAKRIKKRFPKLKISVAMDGLYACGPVIRKCREYNWDYMLVFKEGSIKDTWKEATALMKLNPEESLNGEYGGRKQQYKWANDIEYNYGENGRLKETLHVVICEETWEETSRSTGKTETKSTSYAWISGKEIKKTNVEKRCMKLGRYRWKIENNFLVEKHQGYVFEHCFSYDWTAMKGFHFLMKIGRLINVLVINSQFAVLKIQELGIRGFLSFIFISCKSQVLNTIRLKNTVENRNYQLKLVG